jgi:hypothetical protein
MNKKNIIIIGVLALGSYLFWLYRGRKKNFTNEDKSYRKVYENQHNLSKFEMPKFGKPTYIEN